MNDDVKEGYLTAKLSFNPIDSSSVKTVVKRYSLGAHHNKHCWQTFLGYQNWRSWTTL